MSDHESLLASARPVNSASATAVPVTQNNSAMLPGRTAPAMSADALLASVAGRKAGLVHDVQKLYDNVHGFEQELKDLGPRPVVTDSIPNISDPTAPFGNNRSLGNVLRESGLNTMEVNAVADRLRGMITVLPDLRRGILAASGSTREAAFKGSLAVIDAIRAELVSWERAVMSSAKQEPFARQWDSKKHGLEAGRTRAKEALALVSAERIENFKVAVETAETKAELSTLRGWLKKKTPAI